MSQLAKSASFGALLCVWGISAGLSTPEILILLAAGATFAGPVSVNVQWQDAGKHRTLIQQIRKIPPAVGSVVFVCVFGEAHFGPLWTIFYTIAIFGVVVRPVLRLIAVECTKGGVRRLTAVAASLAGSRKAGGFEEWLGDLAGVPEEGRPLSHAAQWRYSRRLVLAAIRMRLNDFSRSVGRRFDWFLSTDVRVLNTIGAVVGYAAYELARSGGLIEIIRNIQNLALLGAGLWGLALVLRPIRGVAATRRKFRKNPEHQRPE